MTRVINPDKENRDAAMVEKALDLRAAGKGGGEAALMAGFPDYASFQFALGRYNQRCLARLETERPQPPAADGPLDGFQVYRSGDKGELVNARVRISLTANAFFPGREPLPGYGRSQLRADTI
jgi:hypothetical protein